MYLNDRTKAKIKKLLFHFAVGYVVGLGIIALVMIVVLLTN